LLTGQGQPWEDHDAGDRPGSPSAATEPEAAAGRFRSG
jgi:hypothetical protein